MKKLFYAALFPLLLLPNFSNNQINSFYEKPKIEIKNESKKAGILIIDMQRYFFEGISKKELMEEIPNYLKLIDFAKENKLPIYLIEYNLSRAPSVKKEQDRKTIFQIRNALAPEPYYKLIKNKTNAFDNTNLDSVLKSQGLEYLVLTGVYASDCIFKTANTGKENYKIITSSDLMSDPEIVRLNEMKDWYKENTIYFDSIDSVLDFLSK